jgi:hypothetical protein
MMEREDNGFALAKTDNNQKNMMQGHPFLMGGGVTTKKLS